jgi:hypothetical protein
MREFTNAYGETFSELSTNQIVAVTKKYASHNWMFAKTYNSLIEAFGKKFNEFSYTELASFTASLSHIGLRQQDIITESIERLINAGRKTTEEGEAKVPDNYTILFHGTIVPFFEAINHLELENSQELIEKLTNDDFVKRACNQDLNFSELCLKDNSCTEGVLLAILKGNLHEKDPKFKELAEKLIEKINS